MPEALASRPDIDERLAAALEAFKILSATREVSFGGLAGVPIHQRIRPTEAIAVAGLFGWDAADFLRVIAPADALYVETLNRRSASKHGHR